MVVKKIGESLKDQAFLLRSVPYGDDHRILSFLTASHGRVEAIALGARKSARRFSGVLDFLHCLEIETQVPRRGGLSQLLHCELREPYEGVRADYEATIIALKWIRTVSRVVPEGQSVPGLFALLQEGLSSLAVYRRDWVDVVFLRQLLGRLGFLLDLSRCVLCHRDRAEAFYFSAEEGGLLCEACHRGPKVQPLAGAIPGDFWERESGASGEEGDWLRASRAIFAAGFRHYLGVDPE
ncbi:DNA repair protein RecO [Deltaproteobacteria bacterium PRO3]|nr:DNA repair protein RecO [Deltaproteobacteria bacterium PRO3]